MILRFFIFLRAVVCGLADSVNFSQLKLLIFFHSLYFFACQPTQEVLYSYHETNRRIHVAYNDNYYCGFLLTLSVALLGDVSIPPFFFTLVLSIWSPSFLLNLFLFFVFPSSQLVTQINLNKQLPHSRKNPLGLNISGGKENKRRSLVSKSPPVFFSTFPPTSPQPHNTRQSLEDNILSDPDDSFITSFRAYRTIEVFTRQLNGLHLTSTAAEERTVLPLYTAPPSLSAPRQRVPASPRLSQVIQERSNRHASALDEMLGEVN